MNRADHRRPVCGVGVNDANYVIEKIINGERVACPYHKIWADMMKRCYSDKFHERRPTYIGCTVVAEWHSFVTFRAWMISQDWQGKELDKDLLRRGNKIYSKETCVFIDKSINSFLAVRPKPLKTLPMGVTKQGSKYQAACYVSGKTKYLGLFDDPMTAHRKWRRAKAKEFARAAMKQTDSRVMVALFCRASELMFSEVEP